MTSLEQQPVSGNGLVDRVKNILLSPKTEWERIDVEPATVKGLYTGYACILAAIGPIATLIGSQLFGYGAFFVHYRPSLVGSVITAILSYVLGLVGVYVVGLIIDALAPNFGATKNPIQAQKTAVYAWTAAWIVGIVGIFPVLGVLGLLGLYSLYLLYLGLPRVMKAPEDKAVGYTAVTIVIAVVVYLVIGAVVGSIAAAAGGFGMMGVARNTVPAGVVSMGNTKVDLGKLQAASRQMEAAAQQMQASTNGQAPAVQAVPIDTLKGMLPGALPAGYARTEISGESGGVGGLQASTAEGVYTRGDSRITLKVSDMAAAGALATLGGAFGVQSDRETADGYEKVHMVGGNMTQESWDKASKSGKYGVVVASRFLVEAEGSGAEMGDLKGAVGSVSLDRLSSMAKG